MEHTDNSFFEVLAQYVFKIADRYIESVEPDRQTALIDLYTTIVKSAEEILPAADLTGSQSTEWRQVLQDSINWKSVNRQWLSGIDRARLNRNKLYITRLELAIKTTNGHLQQLQISHLSESRRSGLEAFYKHILTVYRQQLAKALVIRKSILAHVR